MSANFDDLLAERALTNATPATIPIIRRSAYLADALRSMQNSTETIRSPGQLVAKLLAEAITQHSASRANDKLTAAQAADQASLANLHFWGIPGLDGSAPAPQAAMANAINPPAQPPQQAPIQQNPLPPIPPQPTQSGLSDAERAGISFGPDELKALGQATWGEARGESPAGQQAVAATAINRAADSNRGLNAPDQGLSIQDVLSAPNQFAGYSPRAQQQSMNSPQMQKIMANLQPLLSGQTPEPSNQPVGFYAPQGMPNGQPASWDHGQPRMAIDHQLFFGRQPGAMQQPPMQMAQNAPPMPQVGPAQPPPVQPYQTASNGPTPPPPMQQAPGAPASSPPLPAPSGGAVPPVSGPSPGMGGAAPNPLGPTPEDIRYINQMKADPRTLPLAIKRADEIQARMAQVPQYDQHYDPTTGQIVYAPKTPGVGQASTMHAPQGWQAPAEPGMSWGQDGVLHPKAGMERGQPFQMAPGSIGQYDPFHKLDVQAVPGQAGAAPPGQAWNGQTYVPSPQAQYGGGNQPQGQGQQQAPKGLIPIGQLSQRDPVTNEVKSDPRLGPALEISGKVMADPVVQEYQSVNRAYDTLVRAVNDSTRNSGILDNAAIDTVIRNLGGRSATVGAMQIWMGHMGLPEEIKGKISNLMGNGYVTPKSLRDALDIMRSTADASYSVAQNRVQGAAKTLEGFGVADPQLSIQPVPEAPHVRWLDGPQPGGPGGASPYGGLPGAGAQAPHYGITREEAAAEIQRRRNQAGRAPTTPHIRNYNPKTGGLE